MTEMTDKELAAQLELVQTRHAMFAQQFRACKAEAALADMGGQDTAAQIRALMVEQEKRAKASEEKPAKPE